MKKLFLFVIAAALFSCQNKPQSSEDKTPKVDSKLLVSCEGIGEVKLSDTYQELEKKFGKDLSVHENTAAGRYLTLWDGQPKQLNIYFEEKTEPFKKISSIETFANDAPYQTEDGVKAGMTGKELQKINTDMPVTMVNPYAVENPGLVKSFNNGQIATNNPCLGGHMEVSKQRNIPVDDLRSFQQEEIVDSSHKLMAERMEVVLSTLSVSAKK
ncbi:MAG: hypothetical protein K0S09_2316 [Sphingobacteriaceae bacterium]|jgi:hypothetical protein|nr:hypothetical protein [Sphingobacteriaceae bacterium]